MGQAALPPLSSKVSEGCTKCLNLYFVHVFNCFQVETSTHENSLNTEKTLDIPKELWMMVDYLFHNAIKQVRKCWFLYVLLCFHVTFEVSKSFAA